MNPAAAALEQAERRGEWRGTISATVAQHDEDIEKHAARLSTLEKDAWTRAGKQAIGGMLGSLAGGAIVTIATTLLLRAAQ